MGSMIRLKKKYSKAIELRKKGFSLTEIKQRLHISKSTASLWLRDVKLSSAAIERLAKRGILGMVRSKKVREERRQAFEKLLREKTSELLKNTLLTKNHFKILCALLFWCEGGKELKSGIRFINSDSHLIKAFLTLLRKSFKLNEKKFRVGLHLHQYHDEEKQKNYWSKITKIPKSQFIKVYWKPNTKKRIRKDYPGCATVYYYNSPLAKELTTIYKVFVEFLTK